MIPWFETREKTLDGYVDEVFGALSSQLPSRDDVVKYINSLDSHETAELFIKICGFYLVSKKYQSSSYVKQIMIISAIERTVSKEKKYKEFAFWFENQVPTIKSELQKTDVVTEKVYLEIFRSLREEYFEIFGSYRNVIEFFQKHVSKTDKLKLIKSFRAFHTKTILGFSSDIFRIPPSQIPNTIEETGKKFHKHTETG